jgi:cell division protein FtsZ
MGVGIASGKSRAKEAAIAAIDSPLLESSIRGAKGVVFNITGGSDLTLHEVSTAADTIYEVVDPNANIIFGAVIDERRQGEIQITVIATGFSGQPSVTIPTPSRTAAQTTPDAAKTPKSAPATPEGGKKLDIPEFLQRRRPGGKQP